MEFKQDDTVVFKKPVTSHDGEKVAGMGTIGKVTVVGIGLHNGDTNGIEVLCEGEGYFHCRPQDLDILGEVEPDRFQGTVEVTRQNFAEVAQWANKARITTPWTNPVLHVKTGFSENPDYTVSVNVGDRIEKLPDGKFQVWVKPYTPEDRPTEMKKFRTTDPILQARKSVHFLFYNDIGLPLDDVYVVMFASVLGGWKALVSTNVLDNAYYEVTHNGSNGETYVDRYIKEINVKLRPDGVADFTQISDFGRIW